MRIAVTGHRPEKCASEDEVRARYRSAFERLRPRIVVVGMASGVDLWAGAEAVLQGIELWCARPWAGHKARKADAGLYNALLDAAVRVEDVHPSQTYLGPWLYQRRNEWMVDRADMVLAYWDGSASGTRNCIDYAEDKNIKVENLYV